ncbi:MAG: circadian clock KaiB family protein [Anaerolineales bacterium]
MATYHFKLYIVGQTLRSQNAITHIQHICRDQLGGDYHLSIIDILEQPQTAEQDKILATPTLVKEQPLPVRRVIGDLSEPEKVLIGLGLKPQKIYPPSDHRPDEKEVNGGSENEPGNH